MKKASIFWKILLSIFLVSALSILSFGVLFYHYQKKALIERTIDQLQSVNILKKEMVQKRLSEDEKFIWHFIRKILLSENGKNGEPRLEFHCHKDFLRDFCKDYGHRDVLLLNNNQEIVDQLYDGMTKQDTSTFSFTRVFLIENSEYQIALVSSTSYLEKLLFERTGMGNTGESYLVSQDRKLITKSHFFPNKPPNQILANENTIDLAFKDGSGAILTKDYRDEEVLSAFAQIQHPGISWAILSEMDLSEAMQTVVKLRLLIIYLGFLVLLVAFMVTVYLSKSISKPIIKVSLGIDAISRGLIPAKMEQPFYPNEQGQMKLALNRLIESFDKITAFAYEIGKGNLQAHFEPLGEHDLLGKSLLEMRKQLVDYRKQEEKLNKRKALFLLEGQENERRRIARDLHDGLGQWLTGLKLKIASVEMPLEQKEELKELASETIEEVRRITNNLMPNVLIDFGLDAALRQISTSFQKTTGLIIQYSFRKATNVPQIPFEVNITLYRIVQEALNNIAKHAKASLVTLNLEKSQSQIRLWIEDNGNGFSVEKNRKKGNGLSNMEERVKLLNGKFAIESKSEGTKIHVSMPLAED